MNEPFGQIVQTEIDTADILPIARAIGEVVQGHERTHVLVTLISMTISIMNPMITPEQLSKRVADVSQYICLLTEEDVEGLDSSVLKNKIN